MIEKKLDNIENVLKEKITEIIKFYIEEVNKSDEGDIEKIEDISKLIYIYKNLESGIKIIKNLKNTKEEE